MTTRPGKTLETFPNPKPERDYQIRFECPEFTCLCPKTGQPDFAVIRVEYVPDALCVELKSWKLYLWSYRDEGAFHEAVTNRILDDLVAATKPRRARVEGVFNVRGGITTTIVASYPDPGALSMAEASSANPLRSRAKLSDENRQHGAVRRLRRLDVTMTDVAAVLTKRLGRKVPLSTVRSWYKDPSRSDYRRIPADAAEACKAEWGIPLEDWHRVIPAP
jgi:7-cyano-7-deazaguanine reductase